MEAITILSCEIEFAREEESKIKAKVATIKKYIETSSILGNRVLCVVASEKLSFYVPTFLFGKENWATKKKRTPQLGVTRITDVIIVLEGLVGDPKIFTEFSVPGGLLNVIDAKNVSTRKRKELKSL